MFFEPGALTSTFTEVAVIAVAAVTALRSFYILQPGQSAVKMFLGKVRGFDAVPGPHLKNPLYSLIKLDTRQKFKDLRLENVKTHSEDGYFVTLPLQLQYRIVDPGKYLFNADGPEHQMESQIENVVRAKVADMRFDQLYTSKDDLEKAVEAREHGELQEKFGIQLDRVIPGDPQPNDKVMEAINEGVRLKETAKGNLAAAILEGEGIAARRAKIFEKYPEQIKMLTDKNLSTAGAEALVALSMVTDAARDIGLHGNMVLATTDPASIMHQFAALGKMFGQHGDDGKDRQPAPAGPSIGQP